MCVKIRPIKSAKFTFFGKQPQTASEATAGGHCESFLHKKLLPFNNFIAIVEWPLAASVVKEVNAK